MTDLPTDCPECHKEINNRDDALVHMLKHIGEQ